MKGTSQKFLPLLLAILLCNLTNAQTHSDGTASLSGVIRGGSGANLVVHLQSSIDDSVRYYDGYEAVPQLDGSFSFTEIPPGHYRVSVEATNQFPSASPSRSVPLRPDGDPAGQLPGGFTVNFPADMASGVIRLRKGEQRRGVALELTHKLSICGRVTHDVAPRDQWGRDIGVPNIAPDETQVVFFHFNPEFKVFDHEGKVVTGKDGTFRITDLAPGTYYIGSGFIADGLGPHIWFPGSASFSQSKPIVVGVDPPAVCNSDISEPNNTGGYAALTSIAISGGDPSHRYKAALLERNADGVTHFGLVSAAYLGNPLSVKTGATGIYASSGTVEAVLYEEARIGGDIWGDAPTQRVIFDSQTVTLTPTMKSESQNLITFRPHPMASISGEVRMENVTRDEFCPNCQDVYVSILREGNGEFQTVTLSQGNHFDFHNVTPGDYQLFVYTTRPDKVFLKSLIADGKTSQGRQFSVREPTFVPMVVTLSGELSQAAGHISPDVRHVAHWETEGMRPRATVWGKVIGDGNATYTVRLLPVGYVNSGTEFTTKTTANGSFHFDNVPPGVYIVRGHDKDYVRVDYGGMRSEVRGKPIIIGPGAQIRDLTLRAPERRSICGHVTSEAGEPQSRLRVWYLPGGASFGGQTPGVTTDAEGYFRIDGILPADYLLASPRPGAGNSLIGLSSDGKLSGFAPVHVESGMDVGCGSGTPLELHVPASDSRYVIAGTVTGELPPRLGDRFQVELDLAQDMSPYWPQTRMVDLSDDHRFRFDNMPSGQYKIRVYGLFGKKPTSGGVIFSGPYSEALKHLVATQLVTLADKDLSDIVLSSLTLPSVNGTVTIPSLSPPWNTIKVDDITVALVPSWRNGVSTSVLKDRGNGKNEFEIGAVDPGEYELRIQSTRGFSINSAVYLESVRLNGKEVDPFHLHLTDQGPVTLQVILGSHMASVHVHVAEEKAFVVPPPPLAEWCSRTSGNYQIILLPASLLSLGDDSQPEQTPRYDLGQSVGISCEGFKTWATQVYDGNIRNVTPGRYYALALQSGTPIGLGVQGIGLRTVLQRKLWKELAKIATPITVGPGDSLDVNLEDKTLEAARLANEIGIPDEQEDLRSKDRQACCNR